jgi:2-keto-4-pentenoate hydratase/2-oxohepta-3-ene-1,7-dioic acid hydratase in catechol pathway
MKLVTFQAADAPPAPGVLRGETVIGLGGAGFTNTIGVIGAGAEGRARIDRFVEEAPAQARHAAAAVRMLAPVPRPGKLICVGMNYRDHAAEIGAAIPTEPVIFNKFPSAIVGPGATVVLPKNVEKPDYEAELAFVVGPGGRHIAAADWRKHVYGYLCLNDVSARDWQIGRPGGQWLLGKTFDTFAPTGPWLTTADEIADPHNLAIQLSIGGETLQKSNTRNLIYGLPELIAYISSVVTLEPGDIVCTGTPGGVGMGRTPNRWLRPGEEMTVEIEGLGRLTNPVEAEE